MGFTLMENKPKRGTVYSVQLFGIGTIPGLHNFLENVYHFIHFKIMVYTCYK